MTSFLSPTYSPAGGCTTPDACVGTGYVAATATEFKTLVETSLKTASSKFERNAQTAIKSMFNELLKDMDGMEKSMGKAWLQAWKDLIVVEMKAMIKQLNVNSFEASRKSMSNDDANISVELSRKNGILVAESGKENEPSVHANAAAVAAGGYGRAHAFSRVMQRLVPQELINVGLNKKGDAKLSSLIKYNTYRYDLYKELFCDPEAAGGSLAAICKSKDPVYYNADVQPNKFILSRLTLPISPDVDAEGNMFKTLIAIRLNLFGSPLSAPQLKGAQSTPDGRKDYLDRRSYLARYGAVMSVHNLIEGWRMPGSGQGAWIKDALEASDVEGGIDDWYAYRDNPSYREIMYAMTNDRFNSGHYATDLISSKSDIKMEKLVLTSLQLMRLRDYYELLERTALVLAVQVSLMTEDYESRVGISELSTETE